MRACLSLVVLVAACGDGFVGEPYGFYQVTSHTRNDAGCTEGAPLATPPFFEFNYFAQVNQTPFYAILACTSAEQSACPDRLGLLADAPVGWFAIEQHGTRSGNDCVLDFITYAGLLDGDTFRLTTTRRQETLPAPTSCTGADAGARGESMPCIGFEVTAGTQL